MRSLIVMLLLLLLSLGVWPLEYTLFKRIDAAELDSKVQNIVMSEDDRMSVLKSDSQTTAVGMASIAYSSKQLIYYKNLPYPPLQVSTVAYINRGHSLQKFDLLGSTTISYNISKISNSNIIGTPPTIIFSYLDACPTLMFLNTITNQTTFKVYETGEQCKFNNSGYLHKINPNTYVYAIGNYFYVLDDNYTMKTKIVQPMSASQNYQQISSITNPDTNMSTLALTTNLNYVYIFAQAEQYRLASKIYNPTFSFTFTSLTTANSYFRGNIYRWSGLRSALVYMNEGTFCFALSPIVLFNDQTQMAVGSQIEAQQYRINFGTIAANRFIVVQSYVSLNIEYKCVANSGVMNSDDSMLYLLLQSNITKYRSVCRVSVKDKKADIITDKQDINKDGKCPSFGLVSDNRIVTVCVSASNYELQLRNTSNLQIIAYVILGTTTAIADVRVLTSQLWNGTISVQTQKYNASIVDDCITTVYTIDNDVITKTQYKSNAISFSRAWATHLYIVGFKLADIYHQFDDTLTIYAASDLSVLANIPYSRASEAANLYDILVHKSIVTVTANFSPYLTQVYDMSKDQHNWLISSFFKDTKPKYGYGYFIFPSNLTLYQYSSCYGQQTKGKAAVGIYNFAINQISYQQPMGNMFEHSFAYPLKYLYVPDTADRCALTIFALGWTIYKFRDCQPYTTAEQYILTKLADRQPYSQYQYFIQVGQSSWWLLITYYCQVNKVYKAQIRDISDLNIPIWYQQSGVKINNIRYWHNLIAYSSNYGLKLYRSPTAEMSTTYKISEYRKLDANTKGCVTFAGPFANNPGITKIYYKHSLQAGQNISVDVVSMDIKLLTIDNFCQYIAYYDQNKVTVLNITETQLIKVQQEVVNQVIAISIKQNRLIIQTNQQFIVKGINSPNQHYNSTSKIEIVRGQKVQLSYDGERAVRYDDKTFTIMYTRTSQQKTFYNISAETAGSYRWANISGVSFSPSGKVYVSLYSANKQPMLKVAVFSPQPCPPTLINVNMNCQCRSGQVKYQYECVCLQGYYNNGECSPCSFPCSTCYGPGIKCDSYNPGFYAIISVACLLFILGLGFAIFRCKKYKKNQAQGLLHQQSEANKTTLVTIQHQI